MANFTKSNLNEIPFYKTIAYKILLVSLFLVTGISLLIVAHIYISENNKKYSDYINSEDIRNVELKITSVSESDLISYSRRSRKTVGTSYYCKVKYEIDGVKYKSYLTINSYYSHPIKKVKVGDKKIMEFYKAPDGQYKVPEITTIKERDNANSIFYFFRVGGILIIILGIIFIFQKF